MELNDSVSGPMIQIRQYLPYLKRHAVKDSIADLRQLLDAFPWVVTPCILVDVYDVSDETAISDMPHLSKPDAGVSRFLWNVCLHELVTSQKTEVFVVFVMEPRSSHVLSCIYSCFLHNEITISIFNTVTYRHHSGCQFYSELSKLILPFFFCCFSYIFTEHNCRRSLELVWRRGKLHCQEREKVSNVIISNTLALL
jgi:hypothetical protein